MVGQIPFFFAIFTLHDGKIVGMGFRKWGSVANGRAVEDNAV